MFEWNYDLENVEYLSTNLGGILKTLITISTVFAIILLYDYYKHIAKIEYTKWGFPDANSAWFHTSLFYKFFLDIYFVNVLKCLSLISMI